MSDLPKGYEKAPADYSGQVYLESQMRSVRDALNASLRENESLREQLASAETAKDSYEAVWRATELLNQQLAAQPEQPALGHAEADRIVARLLSSDPDFNDCTDAAALIQREIKGPDGFATWRDAAFAERIKRVAAEPPVAQPEQDHAYALGLARGRAEAAAAAHERALHTLVAEASTAEEMRHAIAARLADLGKPTAWQDGLCAT